MEHGREEVMKLWGDAFDELAKCLNAIPAFGERRDAYLTAKANTLASVLLPHPTSKEGWRMIFRNVWATAYELVLAVRPQKAADKFMKDVKAAFDANYLDMEELVRSTMGVHTATGEQSTPAGRPEPSFEDKVMKLIGAQNEAITQLGRRLAEVTSGGGRARGRGGYGSGRGGHGQ